MVCGRAIEVEVEGNKRYKKFAVDEAGKGQEGEGLREYERAEVLARFPQDLKDCRV